nr:ApbE family lipoprotein [uncultured bacterium]
MNHKNRFYRDYGDICSFNVKLHTSDLFIRADKNLKEEALCILTNVRKELEDYIAEHDGFLHSLDPIVPDGSEPEIAAEMITASSTVGVGPMAAVAGAIAERVGSGLLSHTDEVIVENGGDIWMKLTKSAVIGIYAKNIYFKHNVGIKIDPGKTPCSVCTSSPKLGHSISLGKADSVTIIAKDGALADAAATAVCNIVQCSDDIENALNYAMSINGVRGCIIILNDILAVQGDVELCPVE